MKNQVLTLILVFSNLLFGGPLKGIAQNDYKYESTVVLSIKNHSAVDVETAHDLLLKNSAILIDYQCLASGLIVLKLSHNFTHEADVKNIIYGTLTSKLSMKRLAIVFVEIHSKTDQC
jgi:hypothetical protein